MKRLPAGLIVPLLCTVLALGAQAEDAKPSREREALRRAQTALRAAQEQQTSLQADKAKAETAASAAQKEAAAARAQIGSAAGKLKAREHELEALQAQLDAARQATAALQAAQAAAQEREQSLQQQLLAARQDGAGRLQTSQALAQLLEHSTLALADAEAKNRQIYAISQELMKRWQSRSFSQTTLLNDPVLGLAAIRLEDQAEALRAQLEASRVLR